MEHLRFTRRKFGHGANNLTIRLPSLRLYVSMTYCGGRWTRIALGPFDRASEACWAPRFEYEIMTGRREPGGYWSAWAGQRMKLPAATCPSPTAAFRFMIAEILARRFAGLPDAVEDVD